MLELIRVRKTYGERTVLSLGKQSFPPGRVHVLVGPNGSGKSTLLKILAMLLPPDDAEGAFEALCFSEAGAFTFAAGLLRAASPASSSGTSTSGSSSPSDSSASSSS